MVNGKGVWAAVSQDGGEPFEISYEQARGFEPINPIDAKVQKKLRKALKYEGRKSTMRMRKESYSDIDQTNVWDAYELAAEYLGYEGLCDALAKAMGTDALESNLKYICRVYEIPFMEDEEEFDESYARKKTMRNEDLSDDMICKTCSNFKVEQTDTGTWVVKADSKRFGKQAIVFEGSSRREALNWMYKHIQPAKESVRRNRFTKKIR